MTVSTQNVREFYREYDAVFRTAVDGSPRWHLADFRTFWRCFDTARSTRMKSSVYEQERMTIESTRLTKYDEAREKKNEMESFGPWSRTRSLTSAVNQEINRRLVSRKRGRATSSAIVIIVMTFRCPVVRVLYILEMWKRYGVSDDRWRQLRLRLLLRLLMWRIMLRNDAVPRRRQVVECSLVPGVRLRQ